MKSTGTEPKIFPDFYDPAKVGQLYLPDLARAIKTGLKAGLTEAATDKKSILLLMIDPQVDFVFNEGSLSVPGAIEDAQRTIEWIYRNAGKITGISCSLDSHTTFQIFYPTWWVNEAGEHPAPFTQISISDVQKGVWKPLFQPEWSVKYVEALEKGGKYVLMIWPYHTMIGSPGHSIVPALSEAIAYHSAARKAPPTWLVKGTYPHTENYSIFEPEVKEPDYPQWGLNTAFLNTLQGYDLIYLAGQAKSHCVIWTIRSLLQYFSDKPEIISRLRLMVDCTSPVDHATIDFEALANEELAQMEKSGLKLVTSADALG